MDQPVYDWDALLRDAASNPDAVRDVWYLAREYAPGDEALRRRIEAVGKAAAKSAGYRAGAQTPARTEDQAQTKLPATASTSAPKPIGSPRRPKKPIGVTADTLDPAELEMWAVAVRADVDQDADDDALAAALAAWHRHVRVGTNPVRITEPSLAMTGASILRMLHGARPTMKRPEKLHHPIIVGRDGILSGRDGGLLQSWHCTVPEVAPPVGRVLLEFDITAQYLGAARSGLELGDGEPDFLDTVTADMLPAMVGRPGFGRLAADPDLSPLRPVARASLAGARAKVWLPMPTIKYLHQRGAHPALDQAVVWPQGRYGRRLDVWASTVGTARRSLITAQRRNETGATLALAALKTLYGAFLGSWLRSEHNTTNLFRPDWTHQVIALAGNNALRGLDRLPADVEPCGGVKDAFWLLAPEDTALPAHGGLEGLWRPSGLLYSDLPDEMPDTHDKPGQWHLNRACVVSPELARAHAAGRHGTMQRLIVTAHTRRQEARP